MPMCTYLSNDDYKQPTTDKEINALLADVRRATEGDWRVCEEIFSIGWLNRRELKLYTLYHHLNGPEYQIINFYQPKGESIHTMVSAEVLAAYFYGLLSQVESKVQ